MTRRSASSLRRQVSVASAAAARLAQGRRQNYVAVVVLLDAVAVATAVIAGHLARFGPTTVDSDVPYGAIGVGLVVSWMLVLYWSRCYDDRVLGYGTDEYRRVFGASLKIAGGIAVAAYLANVHLSRGFLGVAFVIGALALPTGRYCARQFLHHARARDRGWARRVLAVGDVAHVVELNHQLRRDCYAGYQVVGACVPGGPAPARELDGVPVVGGFDDILEAAVLLRADTVAVTASVELTGSRLRRLGWQMEGTGIDLLLAPTLTDVAGPRIHMSPVAGLPLIHVSSPEFRGARKALKGFVDRSLALLGLLMLAPVFCVIALAITVDSRGPVFFRQTRVGWRGREFGVYKFRSMVERADAMMPKLAGRNEGGGLLFKMRDDPRVTRVGAFLRKWSLDELPQLINVVLGEMSLVGPRPPLPTEVAWYDQDIARRLLVKPGMTGLWQVSGRSDLSWEDGIRLDLYYVENWSLAADLTILWKTVGAVLQGKGAY